MDRVDFTIRDGITPELRRIARKVGDTRKLMAVLGKQLEVELRGHFRERNATPNKQGFPRRNFWSKVRQSTALTRVTPSKAVVTISEPAFAHKVHGGTIRPKRAGALSIPISPEAYRTGSASLFTRPLSFIPRPNRPPLLVEVVSDRQGREKEWKLHYVLLKSVTHAADPKAWPQHEPVERAILDRGRAFLRSAGFRG